MRTRPAPRAYGGQGAYQNGHGRETVYAMPPLPRAAVEHNARVEERAEEAIRRRRPEVRDRMLAQLRRRPGEVLPAEGPVWPPAQPEAAPC